MGKSISEELKLSLINKKNKHKNYGEALDKLLIEKESYIKLIKSNKTDNISLNDNQENIIQEDEPKLNNEIKEELKEEFNNKLSQMKEENKNEIIINSERLETKIKSIEKMISLINNNIKITEDKINNKFSNEIPQIFENLYSEKISTVHSKIDFIDKNYQKSIKYIENSINEIKRTQESENLKFEENVKESQKLFKEIKKINSKLEEKINNCVELKVYNQDSKNLENKIQRETKELNNNILIINQNLEKFENQIRDLQNDLTTKNNLILLSTKCDHLAKDILKLKEMILDLQSVSKKNEDIISNVILKDEFMDFKQTQDKNLDNIKRFLTDVKNVIDEIKITSSRGKATLKDLKILEDKILIKLNEFYDQMTEKFAEKKFVLRNNRYLKIDIKKDLENYKNIEQKSDGNWLLSKKPLGGHLCASCESYIGDLKENENYIAWNQYPLKESSDKASNVNHIYDKMFQKLSTEYKIKRNNSNIDIDSTKKLSDNYFDDVEIKQNYTNLTNKRQALKIKDKNYKTKINEKFRIKEIPKLKNLKKDHFPSETIYNKNKSIYPLNSKAESDENIKLAENSKNYNKNFLEDDRDNEPKIMKVFKKLI